MMVMSRSPKTTMAAVRGMGVAVITSRSGSCPDPSSPRPLARRAARCSTPKRCCSSITATPRDRKATWSVRSACVPMRTSTEPSARPAWMRARSADGVFEVSRATRNGRSPAKVASSGTDSPSTRVRTAEACCSASTSVGAISAPWCPPCTATNSAGHGHHRLARSHVPLEETVHGKGPGQVGADHRHGPPLGRGELEAEPGDEAVDQGGLATFGDEPVADPPGVLLEPVLAQDQGQLQPEELVEGQPAAGRLALLEGGRPVDLVEGRRPVDQLERGPPVVGQRIGEGSGAVEGLGLVAGDAGRGQVGPFGERVDREHPSRAVAREGFLVVGPGGL